MHRSRVTAGAAGDIAHFERSRGNRGHQRAVVAIAEGSAGILACGINGATRVHSRNVQAAVGGVVNGGNRAHLPRQAEHEQTEKSGKGFDKYPPC